MSIQRTAPAVRRTAPRRTIARRALDVLLAFLLVLGFSPLLIVCLLLVWTTSRGPALFGQERVGLGGRRFTMYKFRTMRHGCDETSHRDYVTRLLTEDQPPAGGTGDLYKLQKDPRVTAVGRFLRRTSLDELPQLLNVLKGDMAIVGPRPVLPYEAELFEPRHLVRFQVPPGMTGLWQVSGRGRLTMRQALDLDVAYVETQHLGLDLRILMRTLPALFSRGETS
jgi:lipopolysaccharide/colanic/teichoic acid biosynthesis glycosyltransferase